MSNYWRKRFELLEQKSNAYGLEAFRQIEPAFINAEKEIQKEIEAWYGRYAKNNNVSMLEARRQLSTKELKEFRWDVDEYIKYGRENAIDSKWMKELENASARVHINRLEALKIRTQQAAEAAFGNELDVIDAMARKVYTEDYYHSIFEMHKGFGVGWNVGQVDERKLGQLISKPWAADGKNFSQRIWNYRDQLVKELHTQMTQACVLGKHPKQLIDSISKKFKTTKGQAGRLVMTEQAFFHSAAQKDAFKTLDVEEFEVVATLDSSTSDICQDMDGQHFPMSEYEPGVTAPPFHCWCRSVTAPYFEDNYGGERAARGADGKTYYVPDDLTYKDWKKSLVGGNGKGLQPIDDINELNKQLADKQREFNDFAKEIQQVKDDKRDWTIQGNNQIFTKFNNMSDDERAKYIKHITDEKDVLKKEIDELDILHDKYFDKPDRTIDREKWLEWREWRRTIDYDDLYKKLSDRKQRFYEIDRELWTLPKFEAFKARFGDMTEQKFLDEIDDLTAKQAQVQKEIDEITKKIKDAERIQNQAVYSKKSLQEIKDEIINKHEQILKTTNHKTEFADIVDDMNRERAILYDKMSDLFNGNQYYKKGTGWYSQYRKQVEMDMNCNPWDKGVGRNLTGAWKTKFHEEMHQLDHILGASKSEFALLDGTTDRFANVFTKTTTVTGKKMIQAIDEDIVQFINDAIDWENKTNGLNIKRITNLGKISSDAKRSTIQYLKKLYPNSQDRVWIDTLTDAIGMTTGGRIHPYSNGFWGHKLNYCQQLRKDGATSEAWANLAGFMLRGDTEALAAVAKVMPKTVSTYQEVFDEVLEYAKNNDVKY